MKRLLPFIIVGVVIIASSAVLGSIAVYYATLPGGMFGRRNNPTPPFALEELEDLQDKPDKAAGEIPRIIACFADDELGDQAAETLRQLGPKAVDPVRKKLTDPSARVRFYAVQTLSLLKTDAAPAAPELVVCLQDDDPKVRYKAVYALGQTGVKSEAVFNGLLKALEDKDERVPETATTVLETFGAPPKGTLAALTKLASKDSPLATRTIAFKLLGQAGKDAVPTFQELLKTSDALDTITIIQSVAPFGADAKPLLPELQAVMLKTRNWDAEDEMLGIFKKCGPDGAAGLAKVLKTFHDPKSPSFADDERSVVLLRAIGDIGSQAAGTVPVLVELLKESDRLRLPILQCLGDIGPAAKSAIPAVEALVNANTPANDPARVALRRMGKFEKK